MNLVGLGPEPIIFKPRLEINVRLHLDVLKYGFCVVECEGKFSITPEGMVVKRFKK